MRQTLPLLVFLASALSHAESLRIMSYNVRFANPEDGPNRWENRLDIFLDSIRTRHPDLIGTQELLKRQGDDIVKGMPEYAWFGISRRGNDQDEHMGVFYLKSRLELLDSGNFWLSETPERPGSSSWNMSLPRMVTWGRFRLRGGPEFLLLNTHFAHRREDEPARLMSAKLIAGRIGLYDPKLPIVLTGDFNAPAGEEAYGQFAGLMKDAWVEARERSGPEGTFHGFRGKPSNTRIDWILYRAPWKVSKAETVIDQKDGRFPSDHFAVFTVFDLP